LWLIWIGLREKVVKAILMLAALLANLPEPQPYCFSLVPDTSAPTHSDQQLLELAYSAILTPRVEIQFFQHSLVN